MGQRRTHATTMAELAESARQEAGASGRDRRDRRPEPLPPDDPYVIELGSHRYDVRFEPPLSADEAQVLATTSRLVVHDDCGCGGGCGYETWTGSRAAELVQGGPPVVRQGELLALLDRSGAVCGVLVVQDVRWGRLGRRGR